MPKPNKFHPTMYVTAFELAQDQFSDNHIARVLGVSLTTFQKWVAKDPTLVDALTRGRKGRGKPNGTFHEYVYDRLPPNLQATWDKLTECEDAPNGIERIEAILADQGQRVRQHLFVYALVNTTFNVPKALRKLNMTRGTLRDWTLHDPDFAALVDEIHHYKKDFYENAFNRQVKQGQILAVLHAVKTQCRDRGFGDKLEVKHTGSVEVKHTINVADLPLPLAVRQQILVALRTHNTNALPAPVPIPHVPAYAGVAHTDEDDSEQGT